MAIKTHLKAWYSLDDIETATFPASSHPGGAALIKSGSPTAAVGKVGVAGQFVMASNQFLVCDSSHNLNMATGGGSFAVAAWCYIDAITTFGNHVIGKDRGTSSGQEFRLTTNAATKVFRFIVTNASGSGTGVVESASFGPLSTATWYYVVAWHDAVAQTINIQVNNGLVDSVAHTGGVFSSSLASFRVAGTGFNQASWNGRLDEVGYWVGGFPTADERTDLYNGGAGIGYGDLSSGLVPMPLLMGYT